MPHHYMLSGKKVKTDKNGKPLSPKQKKIASAPIGEYKVPKDTSYKKEISKQYTVAIAYNKGAYQVIPNSDLKHIGK